MSKFISVEPISSGLENLAIRDTASPSTLKEIFDKICSTHFVASKSYNRRKSVDREIGAEETVDLKNMGASAGILRLWNHCSLGMIYNCN